MNEQAAKGAETNQKILEVLKTERGKRAEMVLEQTVILRLKEEAACNDRDAAVTRATNAELRATDAGTRMQELEQKVTELNTKLETANGKLETAGKLYTDREETRGEQFVQCKKTTEDAYSEMVTAAHEAHDSNLKSAQENFNSRLSELKVSGDVSKTSAEALPRGLPMRRCSVEGRSTLLPGCSSSLIVYRPDLD